MFSLKCVLKFCQTYFPEFRPDSNGPKGWKQLWLGGVIEEEFPSYQEMWVFLLKKLRETDPEMAFAYAHDWELKTGRAFPWPRAQKSAITTFIHPAFGECPEIEDIPRAIARI